MGEYSKLLQNKNQTFQKNKTSKQLSIPRGFQNRFQRQVLLQQTMKQQQQQLIKQSKTEILNFFITINNQKYDVFMDSQQWLINGVICIRVQDMIGLVRQNSELNRDKYSLNYYPREKRTFKKQQRYIRQFFFQVDPDQKWNHVKDSIISRINNRSIEKSFKLLVFFNPVSGSNSKKHLNSLVNFVKYTNLQIEIVTTKYRNHCLQFLNNLQNASSYCGVAIVSGDGLVHEFVNSKSQLPLTHVPAGSGNAFAKNQMSFANEQCKVQESIFLVIKNRPKPFNLFKYELQNLREPVYSFLSLEWAIMADLDVNSQFLRCLGALRFQIYAVWLILRHKSYRVKLSYSTTQKQIPPLTTSLENNPNYLIIQGNLSHSLFSNAPYISQKHKVAPLLKYNQQFIDMQLLEHNSGRFQLAKYMLNFQSGSHFNLKQERPAQGFNFVHRKVSSFRLQPNGGERGLFCIDGELYEEQKLQGSLSQKRFYAFL